MADLQPLTAIIIDNWTARHDPANPKTKHPYSHGELVERSYFDGLENASGDCFSFHRTVQGFDANNDGTLSDEEKAIEVYLSGHDANNNGQLDDEEVAHRLLRIGTQSADGGSENISAYSVMEAYKTAETITKNHVISTINVSSGLDVHRGIKLGKSQINMPYKHLTLAKARAYALKNGLMPYFAAYKQLVTTAEERNTVIFQTANNDTNQPLEKEKKKASIPTLQSFFHSSPNVLVVGNQDYGQQVGVEIMSYSWAIMGESESAISVSGNSFGTPLAAGTFDGLDLKERSEKAKTP